MARSIATIKAGMASEFMGNETVAGFYGFAAGADFASTFSPVSLESILFYIVASAIFTLESMFDTLKAYVDAALNARLTHNRQWIADRAKEFQYGDAISLQTGKYDVIDASKRVVSYASCDQIADSLYVKIAAVSGDTLAPLSAGQVAAFEQYMSKVMDAGVVGYTISDAGDKLRLVLDIYYDPMVMDVEGNLLDGGGSPVGDTVRSYIKSLPFNSEFTIVALTDALQATRGVAIPTVLSAESKYATNEWSVIDARVKPHAGYLVIDRGDRIVIPGTGNNVVVEGDLTVTYRPYDVN